jgi:hypothetical protein
MSFVGTYRLHLRGRRISQTLLAICFVLVSCLAYSSALKNEATCSSETSDDFQRTTYGFIPEDVTLRNRRCENLKPYVTFVEVSNVKFQQNL